ncbi:LysE family transporter [bacterium]|nr:LysE family transporter [bacterium]
MNNSIPLYQIFLASFTVAFVGAASPGPLMVVTIAKSLKEGIKTPFIVVGAHALLELLMLSILLVAANAIKDNHLLVSLIGVVGGLCLAYLGYGMWRSESSVDADNEKRGHSFVLGAVATMSNPYWFLWWATIGFTFLLMGWQRGILGVLVFYIGHELADLVWYLLVGALTVSGKKKLERYSSLITQIGGILLIFLGAYFFAKGLFG